MYFITGLHEEGNQFIAKRCFGFYPRKHQAVNAISERSDDLHEDTFTHLVIEKCTSGVYPQARGYCLVQVRQLFITVGQLCAS